jgi:WD40 repeat protein
LEFIIIWNTKQGKYKVIKEENIVKSFHFQEQTLVATCEQDLKLWSLETLEFEKRFVGHSKPIQCVQLDVQLGLVVSGGLDNEIRIWSLQSGECIRTLSGHKEAVRNVKFDKELVVSCSDDTTVVIWNLHTGLPVHKLLGHTGAVDCIAFNQIITVSGSTKDCTGFKKLNLARC